MISLAELLFSEIKNISKGHLIKSETGSVPQSIIVHYSFENQVFGVFDKLLIRYFQGGSYNLEFESCSKGNDIKLRSLVELLFSFYHEDSNRIRLLDTPCFINPFDPDNEYYVWYINQQQQVIIDDNSNMHHGVILDIRNNSSELTILIAENLIPFSELGLVLA